MCSKTSNDPNARNCPISARGHMNKPIPKKKATLAGTKRALHDMMQQDGLAFPATPEDVDRIEATVDDSRLPTPNVNGFLQSLRGHDTSKPAAASKILPFESAALAQDLAMVARNGGDIDPDIRKRMDEHRDAAETKSKKKR